MTQWHFAKQRPDDVDDETTVSKNFARESRLLSGVFVREFFQNVLDARLPDASGRLAKANVRIAFVDSAVGLSPSDLAALLPGLEDHLTAAGHEAVFRDVSRTNALVLEEFQTSGLIGQTDNSRAKGVDQRWANFWFGEGKRTKKGSSLGRAGQGKITYHLISGSCTVFALTQQAGQTDELLFGKCIVQKTHQVGGSYFKRHGYWPVTAENDQPLPSRDKALILAVKKKFGITRRGESGTSWIIPYVDPEAFKKESLISEILRDFFFSVLAGNLTLDVMGTTIDQANLTEIIEKYPISDLPSEFVHFLKEAIVLDDMDPIFIRATDNWYGAGLEAPMVDGAFEELALKRARDALDDSSLIAVKLPITVHKKGESAVASEISLFLKRPDNLSKTEEIYVRSGLVIGEEEYLRNAPGRYYGLMRATDPAISEFLGFAEEASHMRWNPRESEVVERYKNVAATIASVRHSLPKLAKLLLGHTSGRHDDALIDFLSIPSVGQKGPKSKTTKKKGKTGGGGEGGATATPPRFHISQSGTSWSLTPGPGAKGLTYPLQLRIDLAYATMPGEGNPFKVYHRFEFDLGQEGQHPLTTKNAAVLSRDLNRLEVELTDADFEISLQGFSEHALKSRVRGLS